MNANPAVVDTKIKIAAKLKSVPVVIESLAVPPPAEAKVVEQVVPLVTEMDAETDEGGKFTGKPIMKFETKTGTVLIFRTLKGEGLWVTGETKDHKQMLKNAGGTWNSKMVAWLFNLPAKYILVPYFMDKSLGL